MRPQDRYPFGPRQQYLVSGFVLNQLIERLTRIFPEGSVQLRELRALVEEAAAIKVSPPA